MRKNCCRFVLVIRTQVQAVEVRNLRHNPGLLPIQLGPAKIQKYYHKIIHYYDINLVINSVDKLGRDSTVIIIRKIFQNPYYSRQEIT